uniref:Uncharacterized protein n=1 Tax=Timema genevievae TaxID=629358 RepID=A0A7R9K6E6_TIMGE|nr:unnamed protein product [Timema genevievae]
MVEVKFLHPEGPAPFFTYPQDFETRSACKPNLDLDGTQMSHSPHLLPLQERDGGGMIQTAEQYQFIHEALALFERSLPDQSAFLWINVGITLLGVRVSVTQPVNSQKNLSKAFVWGYLGRAGDPATSSPTTHTPMFDGGQLYSMILAEKHCFASVSANSEPTLDVGNGLTNPEILVSIQLGDVSSGVGLSIKKAEDMCPALPPVLSNPTAKRKGCCLPARQVGRQRELGVQPGLGSQAGIEKLRKSRGIRLILHIGGLNTYKDQSAYPCRKSTVMGSSDGENVEEEVFDLDRKRGIVGRREVGWE